MDDIISIFVYLLNIALCLIIWSIFEKLLWTYENNVYSLFFGCIFCSYILGTFSL